MVFSFYMNQASNSDFLVNATEPKLYAYKLNSEYTIPLEPFLNLTFESVETIKMRIFDDVINGDFEYVYYIRNLKKKKNEKT